MQENIKVKIEEEIKEFDKLIKKYPYIEELYIGRAILYSKIGEYQKAIKDYEKAHEDYIYDIIAICKRSKLTKEIEKFYTNKIDKDKNNTINYISRARFYMSIGENKKALADCETILKISPKNSLILEFKKILTNTLKEEKEQQKCSKQMNTPKIFLT